MSVKWDEMFDVVVIGSGMAAMLALARHNPPRPLQVDQIARSSHLPRNFLAKILQKLARGGLVTSSRGHQRGYALATSADRITLKQVLEAIEGTECFRRCLFWPRRCSEESPCLFHDEVGVGARTQLEGRLETLTLADLAHRGRESPQAEPIPP